MFYRFGPYHLARLLATRNVADIVGIECTPIDHIYQWERIQVPDGVRIHSFFPGAVTSAVSADDMFARAVSLLSDIRPDVVAVPGWASSFPLTMLKAAHTLGIPATVMSESQRIDFRRTPVKEWVKRRLVEMYSSAVVGGQPHEEYMMELGMKREAIFHRMDAVDNEHFSRACQVPGAGPRKRMLMASARFIRKKNLIGLLTAYSLYRKAAGERAWPLTILGDGPLKNKIDDFIRKERLEEFVSLPGFIQYSELPKHYANASLFVHASTSEQWGLVVNEAMAAGLPVLVSNRCGCARDLVSPGVNGFTFSPNDHQQLASLLVELTSNEGRLASMGLASTKIISKWDVEYFAEQLVMAAKYAVDQPAKRATALQLKGLDILARLI